ncbi:MAG: hypothetical protein JNN15_02050 [Blastocatellia bacterium]|nr:hypothetical protein [Blastocatellia bacterium]
MSFCRSILLLSLFLGLMITFSPNSQAAEHFTIAIQPLGKVDSKLIEHVKHEIQKVYKGELIVLSPVPLPKEAYYAPRNRYRAEKLALLFDGQSKQYSKIVVITDKDISTTKADIIDWGIFGYSLLGRRPAIVSTFRLAKAGKGKRFYERLAKLVYHELGHTFGVDHCPNVGCYMQDVKGKIAVVDNWKSFCSTCQNLLSKQLK